MGKPESTSRRTWASRLMVLDHHVLALWKARIWEPELAWVSILVEPGAMPAKLVTQHVVQTSGQGHEGHHLQRPCWGNRSGRASWRRCIGPETWWLSVVGGITIAKVLGQARAWHAGETEEAREHGEGTGQAGQGLVEGYGPRRGRA